MEEKTLMKKTADTIRILSAEAVQKAKSGHPGMPMGCADFAFTLWYKYLKHNPKDSKWLGRDRFILSAGHGSTLLYSLLYLFGYDVSLDDLKNFRQLHSKTPGHPEYGHTDGVEVTTGPLGTGFATGVGMAIAQKHFEAKTGINLFKDRKIYIISGDGCMMEGVTSEAASLAGHLRLDNIICFYDDNNITIEGETSLAFSENVEARFKAYGWNVVRIDNANDIEKIETVLDKVYTLKGAPTLIIGKTIIGYGAPNKQGSEATHGAPLGEEEVAALKKNLGFPEDEFFVPEDVKKFVENRSADLIKEAEEWNAKLDEILNNNPETNKIFRQIIDKSVPENISEELIKVAPTDKAVATRSSLGTVLQRASQLVPALYGGAADLAPSTKTEIKDEQDFSADNYAGRNLHFGVRELAMGFCANGIALYGTGIPYASTFFVFSDFMKPALRLAAIQNLHVIYVFTHDSFFVGEDGPTHQPVEQLAMLRSIPRIIVIRPADAREAAQAWAVALKTDCPVALLGTRHNIEPISQKYAENINVEKGAYILSDDDDFEAIIIATGSELNLALSAAEILRSKGKRLRVVSMPSWELFEAQPEEYKNSVLPQSCKKRISIEAGSTFGWERFTGSDGLNIGIDDFTLSAPYKVLAEYLGFTPQKTAEKIENYLDNIVNSTN